MALNIVSILNLRYWQTLLSFFKFRINLKPPSDFVWVKIGEINSPISC